MIDHFSQAVHKINELRVPISTLAQLCGISGTELSALFNRQKPCNAEKEEKLWQTAQALDRLVKAVHPLPLDWRRALLIREILDEMAEGDLRPVMVRPGTNLTDEIPEIEILLQLSQRRQEKEKLCQNA